MKEEVQSSQRQRSDGIAVGVFLTLAGGFLESYSFITRDEVLANCQSGNMVLFAMFATQGKWMMALRWIAPVCAFIVGVLFTERLRDRWNQEKRLHWRQVVLLPEIVLIFITGLLPIGKWNVVATVLIAFACSMQADAFKKLHGNAYATIMCTANLRSGLIHLYDWRAKNNSEAARKAIDYLLIILCFMAGAAIGTVCTALWSYHSVWLCCLLMAGAFVVMLEDPDL